MTNLINYDNLRPAHSLDKTIDILNEHLANREAINDYSEVLDIYYHLTDYKHFLDQIYMEMEKHEQQIREH